MAHRELIDLFVRRGRNAVAPIADYIDADGDCWEWTGQLDRHGYGYVRFRGRRPIAHRLVYEALVGPIPDGLELDHLCRNKVCVNPDHLEPVTHAENLRRGPGNGYGRKETCKRGHHFSDDNLYIAPSGQRVCRSCQAYYSRTYRRRKVQANGS